MRKGAAPTLALAALCAASRAFASVDPAVLSQFERGALEYIGYTLDEAGKRVLASDGAELTDAKLAALRGPFDWRAASLSDSERSDIVLSGCRFEAAGLVLCLPDKKSLTALEAERKRSKRSLRHRALERVAATLAGEDQTQPLSAAARGYVQKVESGTPGVLPPSLVQAAAAPGAKASDVWALAEIAYLASTRFFDGRLTLADGTAMAAPIKVEPYEHPPFYDDAEKTVSAALTLTVIRRIVKNPVGRQLALSFDGELPPIVVLPIESDAAAFYSGGRIVLSQSSIIDQLVDGLPRAQALILKGRLSKPGALAAYLAKDAVARERLVGANESTIVHELTHALQARRDKFEAEQGRGNVFSGDYAEEEDEAFLTELRYDHTRLLADPKASMSDADLERYEGLIADFDTWRADIARTYAETWPDRAATLATAREVTRAREEAAKKLLKTLSPTGAAIEALKLIGLARGTAETAAYEKEHDARIEAFRKDEYAKMRKESPLVLARAWANKAARETDKLTRLHALQTALEHAERAGDAELAKRLKAELKGPRR